MSATSVLTVMIALAAVLGLTGVALRMLRRYTVGHTGGAGGVRMEVVQRLALGQRQGIAVVRIGQRVLAVSMGDGGVHTVAELDESDLAADADGCTTAAGRLPAGISGGLRRLALLKDGVASEPAVKRISYVAPMEDFEAVLSMAMGGCVRP